MMTLQGNQQDLKVLEYDCKPDVEFWMTTKSKMKTKKIFSTTTVPNIEENPFQPLT